MSQVGIFMTGDVAENFVANAGSATPAANTLNILGTGIITTSGAGSTITISSSGGVSWTEVTAASATMVANNGYIANNAGLLTLTLPATASVGNFIAVVGKGAGGYRIAQNAGQTVHVVGSDTTTGVGGSLSSTVRYDCIEILCTTANTDFVARNLMGNLTIV